MRGVRAARAARTVRAIYHPGYTLGYTPVGTPHPTLPPWVHARALATRSLLPGLTAVVQAPRVAPNGAWALGSKTAWVAGPDARPLIGHSMKPDVARARARATARR